MTRADDDPVQAEADINRLNAAASRADDARIAAEAREDELIDRIDAAHEAGDNETVALLQAQHQQAESAVVDAIADFEIAVQQVNDAVEFWHGRH